MKLINRVGQLLILLSFFLVTPEIVGEARLTALLDGSRKVLRTIIGVLFLIPGLILIVAIFYGMTAPFRHKTNGYGNGLDWDDVALAVLMPCILWFAVVIKIGPIIKRLSESRTTRRTLLCEGACLFTVGTMFVIVDA